MTTATETKPVFAAVGGPFTDEDAQVIGPVFLQLERDNDEVTKETVLSEARRRSSPLHRYFEWDDTTAAEKYRLEQASLILRSITVAVVSGGEIVQTRLMVNVHGDNGARVYKSVNAVMANDGECAQLIEEAREDFLKLRAKYDQYRKIFKQFREQYAELFSALDRL